jgi:hypothetical protein
MLTHVPTDPAPYGAALAEDRRRIDQARTVAWAAPGWVEQAEERLAADQYRVLELEEARRCFEHEYEPVLERLGELARAGELGRRLTGEAAALDPPRHLAELLGPVPAFAVERPRWVAAAGEVEYYRHLAGLGDDDPGLGPPPDTGVRREAYDAALAAVVTYGHRRELRAIEPSRANELGR